MGKKKRNSKKRHDDATTQSRASITSEQLEVLINNRGFVARSLARDNLNSFPIVRFISFIDGKLLLLVGGQCPACESVHLRNICNAQFVAELVEPRLQILYSNITQVKAMMSSDDNFVRTVDNMGG